MNKKAQKDGLDLQTLYDDDAVSLPAKARQIIESPLPDNSQGKNLTPLPEPIQQAITQFITGNKKLPDNDLERDLIQHFNDAYALWIELYGPIMGRIKFWKSVIQSSSGRDLTTAVRAMLLIVKVLSLLISGHR